MKARSATASRLGVVYTPPEVARAIVDQTLAPLIASASFDQLAGLRVCDPAAGEGVFLAAAHGAIAKAMARRAPTRSESDLAACAARCLHGCDIDPAAVATARARIPPGVELVVGDALVLDWRHTFGDPFDAVVGNPPYIRQEHLAATKAALTRFASYDSTADLYVYFLELAHHIVRPGGRYGWITPSKWMTAGYGAPLRRFLAAAASVERVIDLRELAVFDDVDAFPCITIGTVGQSIDTPLAGAIAQPGDDLPAALARSRALARDRWTDQPWFIDDPRDRALIDHLEHQWPRLGDRIGRGARGIVTGCNRAFVIDRATRARLIAEDPASARVIAKFAKGRDIEPWTIRDRERYLLLLGRGVALDEFPAIARHLLPLRRDLAPRPRDHVGPWPGRKPGDYRWYELQDPIGELAASRAPRMIYQDIQTRPAAALDATGQWVCDTTLWMLPTADPVVLAIFNSRWFAWYAARRFPPALNGAVRPKLEYVQRMPLPIAAAPLAARIGELVDARRSRSTADRELDRAIDDAVLDAYQIDLADRERLRND